jgi:hypothetical protein
MRALSLTTFLMVLALTACGVPGAPAAPSLGIPKPVSDLQAARKGDSVTLTWTAPVDTTDGELIRKPGKMQLFRATPAKGTSGQPGTVIAEVPLEPALKEKQPPSPTTKDSLTDILHAPPGDFAVYTVVSQSSSGKSAGPSNAATVPLVPIPATPQQVRAIPVPLGINISWDQAWPPQNQTKLSTQYVYRIMRRVEGSPTPVMVKQVGVSNEAMAMIDSGIEWQKQYDYWITPVTLWQGSGKKGEVEGEESRVVSVFANDVFSPARPAGLQAVFSGLAQQPFIDLAWTANTEPDLAGYNVYRHVGSEAPVKLNSELIKSPSFRDTNIKPGTTYSYSVTAVDLRGNESEKSPEASESVPQ